MKLALIYSVFCLCFISAACQTKRIIPVNAIDNTADVKLKTNEKTTVSPLPTIKAASPPKPPKLICPGKEVRIPFFSLPCRDSKDCTILGRGLVCCRDRCIKGVPPPKPEIRHAPTWFGLVDRRCPKEPIAEILDIKECETDADCSSRICCPEKMPSGNYSSYCRTAEPILDRIPAAKQFFEPIRTFVSYMQCTPPPPPFLDVFPKPCKTPLDCFPNLCCQERGKRICRPPKKSLLAFVAGVGQKLVPTDAAKKLIERLN